MPHQNTTDPRGAAQNAATPKPAPNEKAREQHQSTRPEPRRYAARDVADSTLAPPAAGEVADYMDEVDSLATPDVQQGSDRRTRPLRMEAQRSQGVKTRNANRKIVKREPI
jgi:hypothetical protein